MSFLAIARDALDEKGRSFAQTNLLEARLPVKLGKVRKRHTIAGGVPNARNQSVQKSCSSAAPALLWGDLHAAQHTNTVFIRETHHAYELIAALSEEDAVVSEDTTVVTPALIRVARAGVVGCLADPDRHLIVGHAAS